MIIVRKQHQTGKKDPCKILVRIIIAVHNFKTGEPYLDTVKGGKMNGNTGDGNTLHSTRAERGCREGVDILSYIPVASRAVFFCELPYL